jgi:diguanylate cyclase (GGDEF)-like protein/PAS domain S-box-containing protein
MTSLRVVEGMGRSMVWTRSGPVWIAAGLALDTVLAVLDLALGSGVTLIGLLVAGPLVASMSAQLRGTACVSLYAFALAVGLGPPNGIWASADHAARCAGVLAGGGLSVWLAWLRLDRERSIKRLAIQRAIAQALSESTTLTQAGPVILRTLGEMLDWATAAIWGVEREDVLRRTAEWHVPGLAVSEFERLGRDMTFARGVGLPGRVWDRGEPAWIADVAADGNFPRAEAAAQSGLHGALGVPILGSSGTLGVIEFFAADVREPDADLTELMLSLGRQVGERIERTRAVEETKAREVHNRAIVASALDAMITMDHDGRVIEFNPAAEEIFGYTRHEALGSDMADLIIPPSLRVAHREGLRRYLMTGEGPALGSRIELTGMRAGGSEFPAELAITRVGAREPPTFVGYVRDISERKQAETQLTQSRTLLAQAEEVARIGGWESDVRSGLVECSPGLHRILDLAADGAGVTLDSIVGALYLDDRGAFEQAIRAALRDRERFGLECRVVRGDAGVRVVRMTGKVLVDDDGEPVRLIGSVQDVTEQVEARSARELLANVVDSSDDAILTKSPDGVITSWNRGAERLYGYRAAEAVGKPITLIIPPEGVSEEREILRNVFSGQSLDHFETERVRSDGTMVTVSLTISPVRDIDGRIVSASIIARDITESKRHEQRLRHLAGHDPLTNLPNRRRFEEELSLELARAQRYGSRGAVLCLDLDNFKLVNDSGGHAAGDALIIEVATRLVDRLRSSDIVARLGGDEFGILLPAVGRAEAQTAAEQLVDVLRQCAVVVEGEAFRATASIGVALFESQGAGADEVLVVADLAMYNAKAHGHDRVVTYTMDEGHEARAAAKLSWARRIHDALDEDRFLLYWQPILDLSTGAVSHGELLLRMRGDDGELIAPGAFLPAAERLGLIHEIDRWVVRRAIRVIADQRDPRPSPVAINLSGRSIAGDPELTRLIETELARAAVDPSRLIFEITETAAIANMTEAGKFADNMSRIGCGLALDDFGTGFGSFYYLKHLPVDYLKLDGEFIQNLPRSDFDKHIVKAIVEVARGLGIKTIAESVADDQTIQLLQQHGVDYAQGYHVGRPCPLSEMSHAR